MILSTIMVVHTNLQIIADPHSLTAGFSDVMYFRKPSLIPPIKALQAPLIHITPNFSPQIGGQKYLV